MEFKYEIRIPKERIAVLIGKRGSIKNKIEKKLDVKIEIDSKEGDVIISGEDGLMLLIAQNIVKAISRGFNPEVALTLLKEDMQFELIDITDYTGKDRKKMTRLKGRMIGSEGKSRKFIEKTTNTEMVIFGKTVGIIGEHKEVSLARRAVESLLSGSPHSSVFLWLEKQMKTLKTEKLNL